MDSVPLAAPAKTSGSIARNRKFSIQLRAWTTLPFVLSIRPLPGTNRRDQRYRRRPIEASVLEQPFSFGEREEQSSQTTPMCRGALGSDTVSLETRAARIQPPWFPAVKIASQRRYAARTPKSLVAITDRPRRSHGQRRRTRGQPRSSEKTERFGIRS